MTDRLEDAGIDEAFWTRAVRRRRRALATTCLAVLVVYVAFVAVLSLVEHAPPTVYAEVLLAVVLVLVGVSLWPFRNAAERGRWEERTREQLRIDHALRAHVGIGTDDRAAVTAAAEARRSLSGAAHLGYPLLALFVAFLLFESRSVNGLGALLATLAVVALCALGLRSSRRRSAEARRWLDEPLPPEA
jgi:peptidoglycan/LPS O-acetylase OafA/YrhL